LAEAAEAFRIHRKDYSMDEPVTACPFSNRRSSLRFSGQKLGYERIVNPGAMVDGPVGRSEAQLPHYPLATASCTGLSIQQIVKASGRRRLELAQGHARVCELVVFDPNEGGRALKDPVLPVCATLSKFMHFYIGVRGFLSGRLRLNWSTLQAIYQYTVDCKYRKLQRREHGMPV
jgi:hypothetical protein